MPVTHNNLYDQIATFENLMAAFRQARRGKRRIQEVMEFSVQREERIINILNHLLHETWEPSPPREFVVTEPKLRLIQAPAFEDRVVHHAIYAVITPSFERQFIDDSFACRTGKGHLAAAKRVQHYLRVAQRRWGKVWVLKADISRFFASIEHDSMMRRFARTISDRRVLALLDKIVRQGGDNGRGMGVGSLISQLGANAKLDPLDHTAKDQLGYPYYVRYMDDFIVLLPTKAAAQEAMSILGDKVESLGLTLNPKTAVHPASRGVDFCGYRIWSTHMLPRKRNIKRARRQFKRLSRRYARGEINLDHIQPRVASFLAYTKHCQAATTVESVLGELRLTRLADPPIHESNPSPPSAGFLLPGESQWP